MFQYINNNYKTNKPNTKTKFKIFYFCKNDKTAVLLTLAILLIFSEKEFSKIGESFKSSFLKQNMNIQH